MNSRPTLLPAGTRCRIVVPASTSNMGPGFDCIGCSIDLENSFEFEILPEGEASRVEVSGTQPQGIPASDDNLALSMARGLFERFGLAAPPLSVKIDSHIPSARGLGSSSTAVVAALLAANEFLGRPMDRREVMEIAVEVEGHPDNITPDMLGGLVVTAAHCYPIVYRQVRIHEEVSFVFAIPEFQVKTIEARAVLPRVISSEDAVYNASRTPLVVLALQSGELEGLEAAIDDRLHQPYRKQLFRGFETFRQDVYKAGARGFAISGAGPAMLAICHRKDRDAVKQAFQSTMKELKLEGSVREIAPSNKGATCELIEAT